MKLPDTSQLSADPPKTVWGRLLASTPVVMTVAATLLAGLSNSEMTRAQYLRSLAAQEQSKVGDQWSFYQAKKLRGASLRGNLDLLEATVEIGPIDPEALRQAVGLEAGSMDGKNKAAMDALMQGALPATPPAPGESPEIRSLVEALAAGRPEEEMAKMLRGVSSATVEKEMEAARENARKFDELVTPLARKLETWRKALETRRDSAKPLARNFTAALLRFESARYEAEAPYNSAIAQLGELQVRLSNVQAERHHLRSQWFFFGMLAAQLAVILASLGMALKRRNLMWGFAALIGLAAVGFGVYVYLYV